MIATPADVEALARAEHDYSRSAARRNHFRHGIQASTPGSVRASVPGAVLTDFTAFVPGLRFMLPVQSRVSVYALAGYGFGRFQYPVIVNGVTESVRSTETAHGVFNFGGGVDIRLSRRFSIRGELRDYVTGSGLSGSEGRHHLLPLLGGPLHF